MDRMTVTVVAVSILLLSGLSGVSDGADWTRWRGPSGNGVSPETGWNPRAISSDGSVVWRASVGKGHSALIVRGDRLYTMGYREGRSGGEARHAEVVYCLDAKTGKEVWQYAYNTTHRDFPGPGSTPVLDGELLFTMGRDGDLYCFNAATGSVIWKRNLAADQLARAPQWGFCASPVVEGDVLLLNAGTSGLALDKRTGKVVWASEPGQGWLPTPVVFENGARRLAAISSAGTLYAVDVKTGEVVWRHPWQSDADPIVLDDKVYLIGGGRGNGNALLEISGGEPNVVWETRNMANGFQSSVVLDGHAYGFGRIRRAQPLTCVDLASGEITWSEDLGEWGALIAADNKLVILDGDGDLIIAEATPEAFREISRAKVFPLRDWESYPRQEPHTCWTAPTLANGRIYGRTSYGDLVCVDLSRKAG